MLQKMGRSPLQRTLRRNVFGAVVAALLGAATAGAQQPPQQNASAERDSAFAGRQVRRSDSLVRPLPTLGRLGTVQDDAITTVTKDDLRRTAYSQLAEAITKNTPWTPLSHGGFGQHDALSIMGGTNRDIGTSINGRTLVDPWSGMYQMVLAQPAAFDRIEILTGTDAVGLAPAMTLTAVNMQTMVHNTATPYTALWYHQGGGDIIGADGSFSQNVAENLNVTAGVRRSGALGRYSNTGFDIWNVRACVRWSPSENTHFAAEYQMASLNTDLWGGLRTVGLDTRFTEEAAPTVNQELRDETRRHDATVTSVHLLQEDSSSVITAQVYGSWSGMLRLRDTTLYTSALDTSRGVTIHGSTVGGLVRYDQRLGIARLRLGAGVDHLAVDESVYSQQRSVLAPQAFAHLSIPLGSHVVVKGAARLLFNGDALRIGAGAGLTYHSSDWTFGVDVSTAERTANPNELGLLSAERHWLVSGIANWKAPSSRISIVPFYRSVMTPIVATANRLESETIATTTFSNVSTQTILGAVVDMFYRVGPIELRPVIRVTSSQTDGVADDRFAALMADVRVAYVYEVGRNSVRLGVAGTVLTKASLQQFAATSWSYVAPLQSTDLQYDGLAIFLAAVVGNATVRASWDNILGQRWYTTSLAPEIARSIRLSVDWSFFD